MVLSQSLGYLWVFFLIEDCVSSIQEGNDEEERKADSNLCIVHHLISFLSSFHSFINFIKSEIKYLRILRLKTFQSKCCEITSRFFITWFSFSVLNLTFLLFHRQRVHYHHPISPLNNIFKRTVRQYVMTYTRSRLTLM